MRYLVGFVFVLGLVFLGCGDTAGMCSGTVCPCTEGGILAAVAAGGGPYTFDCDGPTTVVMAEEIVIDTDVILDGEGNLAVEGNYPASVWTVFSVSKGVNAELRGLMVTNGLDVGVANEGRLTIQDCVISRNRSQEWDPDDSGGGVFNAGEMTIINSTISENFAGHGVGGGIHNDLSGLLMLVDSTVSDNGADGDGAGLYGGGIFNHGEMAIINSTVSGNVVYDAVSGLGLGGGIANAGWMSLTNSTVFGNRADSGDAIAMEPRFFPDGYLEIANTLIDGDCDGNGSDLTWVSRGHNIESPGDTCRFDRPTDQVDVTAADLKLGPLANNGGPTMTHALLPGSVAIDRIAEEMCLDANGEPLTTDQRGEPRDSMCDVGAFEVQP
jgi:hypothetical protein